MTASGNPIVVGVSPTTGSPAALRWADREARLRRRPLRAVMAWRPPRPVAAPGGRATTTLAARADHAADAAQLLRAHVRAALGSTDRVECEVGHGSPAKVLAKIADAVRAELLVLGEPRPGRLKSVSTALVARQLLYRLPCPIVALPPSAEVATDRPKIYAAARARP